MYLFISVSAFYFESPEKQIRMNASIWTKSKFMGMSIGVQMVGKSRYYDIVQRVILTERAYFCIFQITESFPE